VIVRRQGQEHCPSITPHDLASRDLGRAWQTEPLPAGAGWYPRITFFGPRDGVLVSASASGAIGGVFDTTPDGGTTWTPVRQGGSFTANATEFDVVSLQTGFAWVPGGDAPAGRPSWARPLTPGAPGRPSPRSWPTAERLGARRGGGRRAR
jgi:hypothetical protein